MAVRPRDGHIFLIDGNAPELLETTRLGAFVRRVSLEGMAGAPAAVAVDMKSEDLLILGGDGRTVYRFDHGGHIVGVIKLASRVEPSLGYDAENHELCALLADRPATGGVFDRSGQLVRTVELAHGDTLIDVGPHSFFRMF